MSFLTTPPAEPQLAAANDYLFALLQAVKLAQARIIQHNLILNGSVQQQEAFQQTWAEIRGYSDRALATGKKDDADRARETVNKLLDEKILQNPAYDQFKIGVAGTDDSLMR